MFKPRDVAVESLSAFLLGGLPAVITYLRGGSASLKQFAEATLPTGFPVWYVFGLSCLALGILALKRYLSKRPIPEGALWKSLHELHDELKGIYRFGAGFLLTFAAMWVATDSASVDGRVIYVVGFGLVALVVCLFYRQATAYIESSATGA